MTAGFFAVSGSAGSPWAMSAGRVHPVVQPNARYRQVVHPGMGSGVAFVAADEIENFPLIANADLPESEPAVAPTGGPSSPWGRATGRVSRVFRRWGPPRLRRRAAASTSRPCRGGGAIPPSRSFWDGPGPSRGGCAPVRSPRQRESAKLVIECHSKTSCSSARSAFITTRSRAPQVRTSDASLRAVSRRTRIS